MVDRPNSTLWMMYVDARALAVVIVDGAQQRIGGQEWAGCRVNSAVLQGCMSESRADHPSANTYPSPRGGK